MPSPRVTKGALIGLDIANPVASVILFQYNPETITRTLQAQTAGGEGATFETQRFKGPPIETIRLNDVEIDATDQLEKGDSTTSNVGIYPQLSALEMLIYPKSLQVIANATLLAAGLIEISPPMGPLTVFVWGLQRIVPVSLTEFSITEEAYDPNLNPIRAKVSLTLRVLSYNDLSVTHPGYYLFLFHHAMKETLASIGSVTNLGNIGDMIPSLR